MQVGSPGVEAGVSLQDSSPASIMWFVVMELKSSGLHFKSLYLLSHLASSKYHFSWPLRPFLNQL